MNDIMRGVVEVNPTQEFNQLLGAGRPLTIKAGFDPTSTDLHIGHLVLLKKLKDFEDAGHNVVIIIGDFTAMIGDPTGKNKTRPQLSKEQVTTNANLFIDQVFRVLDKTKTKVRFNSEWFDKLTASEMIQLSSSITVSRMLDREDFNNRFVNHQAISLHEFLYPLLQGHDSVEINADIEIGGTDQTFNLHMGRHLQAKVGQTPQCVLTMPILLGTDGVEKMSKSLKNTINLTDSPFHIRQKVLNMPDSNIPQYFELLTKLTPPENPQIAKNLLITEIIFTMYGPSGFEEEHLQLKAAKPLPINSVINQLKLVKNSSAAREAILLGKVLIDGVVATLDSILSPGDSAKIQVGKKEAVLVHIIDEIV